MKTQHDEEIVRKLQEITDRPVDLWPSIAARVKALRVRLTPFRGIMIATLFALLIIGIMWLLYPRPVSAAEILDRAQVATQDAAQFGMKGYEGVIDGKMRFAEYPSLPETAEWIYWQNHFWVELPNKERKESYIAATKQQVIPRLDNSAMQSVALSHFIPHGTLILGQLQHVDVQVAHEEWGVGFDLYDRVLKETAYHNPVRANSPSDYQSYSAILMSTDNLPGAVDLDHATQFLSTRFDHVTLKDQETVAGRSAYVVVFTSLKPDKKFQFDDEIVTAWYDQQTYILLGVQLEVKIKDQFELWGEWHFSTFEVNPTFAPQTFVFTPPAGLPIEDLSSQTPTPIATDNR